MREYEVVVIVQPDLDDTAFADVVGRISGWIKDSGGEVSKTDVWGKRQLAYPIRKYTEGQYFLMNVKMAPTFGTELDRNLRFLEPVIRYILVAK
jgi:small subunit ribosomal protein S6